MGIEIKPTISKMTKAHTANGTPRFNCGDAVAESLEGLDLETVQEIAEYLGIDTAKYSHLNRGHQRMMGTVFRKKVRQQDKAEEGPDGAAWFESVVEQFRPAPVEEDNEAA